MGRMTADRCDHWRGLLAMELVGQLTDSERTALDAHLEGCAECRLERRELGTIGAALATADPLHEAPAPVPTRLGDAVVTRLRAEARRDRRQRRLRTTLLSSAAAALVAAAGILAGLQPWAGPAGRTVALAGGPGVRATVTLFPESWGTRLELQESGQTGGQVFTVSMRSRTGRWWDAGTYRTVAGHAVTADFACAVPASDVYAVVVHDSHGQAVLSAEA